MKGEKLLLRGILFLLLLALSVTALQGVFGIDEAECYNAKRGLLKERRGSLDAVYIGASDVHAFWQPLFGWADHGIAVWNYTVSALTCAAVKGMIVEARKTQPDALFIISLNRFQVNRLNLDTEHIHRALNYLPLSANKLQLTDELVRRSEYTGLDALEYYLPVIRFHSRWDDLKKWAFDAAKDDYKMSRNASDFQSDVMDISDEFVIYDEKADMPGDVGEVFEELLDYCDAQKLNALFVRSPQVFGPVIQGQLNTMAQMVVDRGYPFLDLMRQTEAMGIDLRTDFYNTRHTNIHGSLKFSRALGDYLVENYHFQDKRGLEAWRSWDEANEAYGKLCAMYALPFEREHAERFASDIPALAEPTAGEKGVEVTWRAIDGADGYEIFRKTSRHRGKNKTWMSVGVVDAGTCAFLDGDLKASTKYVYTVVPFRETDGGIAYGCFDVTGMTVESL